MFICQVFFNLVKISRLDTDRFLPSHINMLLFAHLVISFPCSCHTNCNDHPFTSVNFQWQHWSFSTYFIKIQQRLWEMRSSWWDVSSCMCSSMIICVACSTWSVICPQYIITTIPSHQSIANDNTYHSPLISSKFIWDCKRCRVVSWAFFHYVCMHDNMFGSRLYVIDPSFSLNILLWFNW